MLIKNRAYLAPDFMSEFDLRRRSREREREREKKRERERERERWLGIRVTTEAL